MTVWQQEIDLILHGEYERAAEVYKEHRKDVTLKDALEAVRNAAKLLRKKVKTILWTNQM